MAAGGDLADVPDHRPAGVEVGRADQQQPPGPVRLGEPAHHLVVEIGLDQPPEAGGVRQRRAAQQSRQDGRGEQVAGLVVGVDVAQRLVVVGAEEGEERDDRAGGDAADGVELRPVAARRPAGQQPRAEGPVRPAARQREHGVADLPTLAQPRRIGRAQRRDPAGDQEVAGLPSHLVAPGAQHRALDPVGPHGLEGGLGHGRALRQRRAARRGEAERPRERARCAEARRTAPPAPGARAPRHVGTSATAADGGGPASGDRTGGSPRSNQVT